MPNTMMKIDILPSGWEHLKLELHKLSNTFVATLKHCSGKQCNINGLLRCIRTLLISEWIIHLDAKLKKEKIKIIIKKNLHIYRQKSCEVNFHTNSVFLPSVLPHANFYEYEQFCSIKAYKILPLQPTCILRYSF